jgi:nucleoside-diphosphate-sugar epimerase
VKIALTGAAGYLGTHLTRTLIEAGHSVNRYDRRPGPLLYDLFDLCERASFRSRLATTRPDLVVHMAARTGRLFGEDDRQDSVRSNAEATVNVAQACSEVGIRMVYASSSEIYGDTGQVCTEDGPYALPHNLYGVSKRWGEEACQLYNPDGLTIWRISMPYGPGAKVGYRGLNALHAFLFAAHNRLPITVHRGSSRSWTYVGDTMAAMLATLERPGVWNIGGDHDHRSMLEVADLACAIADAPPSLITEVEPPTAQTLVKRLSSAKLEAIGWAPQTSLADGMKLTYEWVARHDADGRLVA